MSATTSQAARRGTMLDLQLDEICRHLQLSHTEYEEAKDRYEAVARWLNDDSSDLADLEPEIFPQGSVRVRTAVKPIGDDEHDVDLVLLLQTDEVDAIRLYEAVKVRMEENDTYAGMLEELNRCLRLTYANEFHLDILPARPDPEGPDAWLLVPDQELQNWTPSAPEGHARWFEKTAMAVYRQHEERDTEPLPEPEDADAKSPLHRAVQLMKRRRDVRFREAGDGDDVAPSVILRTLAAQQYGQERNILDALDTVVSGIATVVRETTGVLEVPNPVHPGEVFSDGWDQTAYRRFGEFIIDFEAEIRELRGLQDPDDRGEMLQDMFGETVTKTATEAAGHRFKEARDEGNLYSGSAGIAIGAAGAGSRAEKVRDHEFYGGEGSDA